MLLKMCTIYFVLQSFNLKNIKNAQFFKLLILDILLTISFLFNKSQAQKVDKFYIQYFFSQYGLDGKKNTEDVNNILFNL